MSYSGVYHADGNVYGITANEMIFITVLMAVIGQILLIWWWCRNIVSRREKEDLEAMLFEAISANRFRWDLDKVEIVKED